MEKVKYKPKIDKLFWIILIPTAALLAVLTAVAVYDTVALLITVLCDLLCLYFIISPLFGYVELRESTVFIRLGLFMTREIPYGRIRGFSRERKFYSDSMLSLKNSFEHINVKYNAFDMISVSVQDNEALISEIEKRRSTCS